MFTATVDDKTYNWSEEEILSMIHFNEPFTPLRLNEEVLEPIELVLSSSDNKSATVGKNGTFYDIKLEDDFYLLVFVGENVMRVFLERDFEEDSYHRLTYKIMPEERFFQYSLMEDTQISWETYSAFIEVAKKIRRNYNGEQ